MIKNKILITGGLHGDEPTGIGVAKYFEKGIGDISGIICNLEAIKINKRFVETDLNRSFKVENPISLEENRAKELSKITKKFDLIIDIHNTRAKGSTCAIVVNKPNNLQLFLSNYFGLNKIVIMPPSSSLISLNPESSISIEIATDAMNKFSVEKLVNKISKLKLKNVRKQKSAKTKMYVLVNKVLKLTLDRLQLDKGQFSNFKKLNNLQKNRLGLDKDGSYYPIFFKREEDEEIAFTLLKETDVK